LENPHEMNNLSPADRDDLPLDSDLEVDEETTGRAKPVHLSWRYLGIVAAGGTIGTAIREGLTLAVPALGGVAWIILVINVVGAFCLGLLLEGLVRRGADEGRRRRLRLFIGTGVLGGFTTYSTLATATATLLNANQPWVAVAYALGTLILGAVGTTAGIAVASAQHQRRFGRQTAGSAVTE
jgi:CrcB protein